MTTLNRVEMAQKILREYLQDSRKVKKVIPATLMAYIVLEDGDQRVVTGKMAVDLLLAPEAQCLLENPLGGQKLR